MITALRNISGLIQGKNQSNNLRLTTKPINPEFRKGLFIKYLELKKDIDKIIKFIETEKNKREEMNTYKNEFKNKIKNINMTTPMNSNPIIPKDYSYLQERKLMYRRKLRDFDRELTEKEIDQEIMNALKGKPEIWLE